MNFEGLKIAIQSWAEDRKLTDPVPQAVKVGEEFGELCGAILKNNIPLIRDSIGDVLVTLIILSKQLGHDPVECLQEAFHEIKDRKGKTVGGSFVKEESTQVESDIKTRLLDLLESCRDPSTGSINKYLVVEKLMDQ